MRSWPKIIFFTFLALLVQTSFSQQMKLTGVKPDLLLIFTVFVALDNDPDVGGVYGFSVGLLLDLLGGGIVGSNSLAKTLLGSSLGFLRKLVFGENRLVKVALVFVASVLHDLMVYLVYYLLSKGTVFSNIHLIIFPAALYNMALAALLLPFFGEGKK